MEAVAPFVDRLASLLEYPDRTFHRQLAECRASEALLDPDAASALERFAVHAAGMPLTAVQELYTSTFDLNAGCTCDMGWHLFGERPERAAFLVELRAQLASCCVEEGSELPDYLPHLLKLVARLPPREWATLYSTLAPAVERLVATLSAGTNPYECLVRSAWAAARPAVAKGG